MATHKITADWMLLLHQGSDTANHYLGQAIKTLQIMKDEGEIADWNLDHALKLAAIAQHDFHASSIGIGCQKIAEALEGIGNQQLLSSDLSDAMTDCSAIELGLTRIADAIAER